MLKNRYSPLVVFALLCAVLLLAACTRSATTETVPPTAAEGVGGGGEGSGGDTAATQTAIANMQAILIAGQTQTAQAVLGGAGGGGELLTTNTPTAPAVALPTNTPVPQASTPLPTGPKQYTVKPGDWLYKIARENGVTPEALMAANPGINPDAVLKPGAVLTIPAPGTGGGEGGKTYVVRHGDNLFRIALNNGTTYQKLAELNAIPAPYTVYPGQVLKLP